LCIIITSNSAKMIHLCIIMIPEQENTESKGTNPFPFNNLFLIKGYVSGRNEFWMYLLGLLALFLGYLGFQAIILLPLLNIAQAQGISLAQIARDANILFNPDAMGMNRSLMLALMMGMFVFAFVVFLLFSGKVQKKTLTSMLSGYERFRWKRYFFAFAVWGFLLIVFQVIAYISSPGDMELRFEPGKFAVLFFVALILVPIQTGTEELLFRGYLMQGFSMLFKNGIAGIVVTSVIFGLLHGSNPETEAHGFLLMMPYYILFGAFLGVLTLLDEGAELAMGVHFANNFFSALLVCSKNSVLQTDAIFYTQVEKPGVELISWAILAVICFFVFYKTYRLSNWKLLIR